MGHMELEDPVAAYKAAQDLGFVKAHIPAGIVSVRVPRIKKLFDPHGFGKGDDVLTPQLRKILRLLAVYVGGFSISCLLYTSCRKICSHARRGSFKPPPFGFRKAEDQPNEFREEKVQCDARPQHQKRLGRARADVVGHAGQVSDCLLYTSMPPPTPKKYVMILAKMTTGRARPTT